MDYKSWLEQRIFKFVDGDDSWEVTALEIVSNDMTDEEDEPELYRFARTAKVGDLLWGGNVNSTVDVRRIK
jgi:hypothetical protein|tara:strand:+ start:1030 stop:1242 length:213 start_codon:yes stop_codon:yes gene_type:complete